MQQHKPRRRERNRERGISLIEVMLAATLMAIVLVPVLGSFGFITRQWGTQVSQGAAIETANNAMEMMVKDIEQSMSYNPDDGGKPNVFLMPATDASGNYVPTLSGKKWAYKGDSRIQFYLSDSTGTAATGTVLCRRFNDKANGGSGWIGSLLGGLLGGGGGSSQPLFTNISSLTFTTVGVPTNMIRVSVTATFTESNKTSSYTVTRDIYMSNHL